MLGHTAGKCVSKDKLPPVTARAVMYVIIYNCGRVRHLAKECLQSSNNELCGTRVRAEFGRQETTSDNREPGEPLRFNYGDQGSHAELCRQETTLDNRGPVSATRAACGVKKRNWTRSGTGIRGRCATHRIPRREGSRL